MKGYINIALLAVCLAVPPLVSGQSAGVSFQAYPAGIIGNAVYTFPSATNHALSLYAGFNATDRRDWGKHDDETGSGVGAGLGWRYFFKGAPAGFFTGARADLWFLQIDWVRDPRETGVTDITVLQPTAQLGYAFAPVYSPWLFDLSVSLGAEINVQTDGEPVGEGAILLVGVGVGYRF